MHVREAVEADADALTAHADLPVDALRQLIHDRTVLVAADDDERVVGFVSYDARPDAVHVTQLGGDEAAVARLLEEPARFAENEGMRVEVTVPASETDIADAVESFGFEEAGEGPRFGGEPTRRYRLAP